MKKKKGMHALVVANHHFWIKTTIRTGKLWHTSEEKMICVIWLVLLQLHKLKKNWSVWSGLQYQQPCISFYTKELTKAMSCFAIFELVLQTSFCCSSVFVEHFCPRRLEFAAFSAGHIQFEGLFRHLFLWNIFACLHIMVHGLALQTQSSGLLPL